MGFTSPVTPPGPDAPVPTPPLLQYLLAKRSSDPADLRDVVGQDPQLE